MWYPLFPPPAQQQYCAFHPFWSSQGSFFAALISGQLASAAACAQVTSLRLLLDLAEVC